MTIAAAGFEAHGRSGAGRWVVSLLVVLALHAGLALLLLSRRIVSDPVAAPPAIMIDLAPLAPALPPEPPPPEPLPSTPPPEPPPLPPEPETPPPPPEIVLPPEPIPPVRPVVTLPTPPPKPKLPPKPRPRPIEDTPPPPVPLPIAPSPPVRAAPPPGPSPAAIASARNSWQAQLSGWLERHKRYPRAAEERGQQGTTLLGFALDRNGRVLSFRLARGSGFALLDEEVLALIQRAQPLPAPPPEVPGERFEIVVPISFAFTARR